MRSDLTRRGLLQFGGAVAATSAAAPSAGRALAAAPAMTGLLNTTVERVERITLTVPFRDLPAPHMHRGRAGNWKYVEVCKVHLKCGVTGFGENIQYFVENSGDDAKVVGRNAAELMWDDSHGTGLQQALFDAVARRNEPGGEAFIRADVLSDAQGNQ